MGWLWSNSSSQKTGEEAKIREKSQISETKDETSPSSATPTPIRQPNPEEIAQADFQRMLAEFQAPTTPSKTFGSSGAPSNTDQRNEAPNAWQPSILHPATMSCTSSFDQAFYCQLLGGQFVNYYRYGSLRDCSELWSNFWFCMRTNRGFMSEEERKKRIQTFYQVREARLKSQASSEDVWEARPEEDILRWAQAQFRWDLRRWEKGEAVLRTNS